MIYFFRKHSEIPESVQNYLKVVMRTSDITEEPIEEINKFLNELDEWYKEQARSFLN